jgi:hypothetical protein
VDGALLEENLGFLEADDRGSLDGPHPQARPTRRLRDVPSFTPTAIGG